MRLEEELCWGAGSVRGQEAAMGTQAPVEYAVAVEEFLGRAALGPGSRRVYLVSLTGWAWPIVGRAIPTGAGRRGAVPPVVPLALLDEPATAARLRAAVAERAGVTDARTVNREVSALRSAAGWWLDQGWIGTDPTAGLRHRPTGVLSPPLGPAQVEELLRLPASLREHAFWRLLYDSGAAAGRVLTLDAEHLDLTRHRTRARSADLPGAGLAWREATSQVLRWLLAGRTSGPVFVTDRRARAEAAAADRCPVTGQARMSYRRAAELFTTLTRPLDPAGRGWTLHQLSGANCRPSGPGENG
jgi:integrase/recombinase XerD